MENSVEVASNTILDKNGKENLQQNENISNDGGSSPSSRSSPDTNCPICLGKLENKSFTNSCLHQFCFSCLLEWSKVKAVCPLCKQSFKFIIHNVRSNEDYDEYAVTNNDTLPDVSFIGMNFMLDPDRAREPFRYRTTAVSSYLDCFVQLGQVISHTIPSTPATDSAPLRRQWTRSCQQGTSAYRRNVYQQGLWVQRLPDVTGRVRESSPEFYRNNPALMHRLVPWLNRELNVLCGPSTENVQNAMTRILEMITQVPIRSSAFYTAIAHFTGRNTDHFVHEFHSFATSPYDLIGYDRYAHYVSQSNIAHDIISDISDNEADSDVQIVGHYPSATQPIQVMDSESDECICIENVVSHHPPSPEIITIESESEDDVMQVNIKIASSSQADEPCPGPSWRPPLKRSWITNVHVPTSNESLNVSINIARASRSQSPSSSSTFSSSSSLVSSKKAKNKGKKRNSKGKRSAKGKSLINSKNKVKIKKISRSKNKKSEAKLASPVIKTERKHKPQIVHKSESNNSNYALLTDTDLLSMSSSDESEYKPRLRSVVVRSTVKTEPCSISPSSSHPSRATAEFQNVNSPRSYDSNHATCSSSSYRNDTIYSSGSSSSSDNSYRRKRYTKRFKSARY